MSHDDERRLDKRFRPDESTLVIGSSVFGRLLDLSMGGLGYAAKDEIGGVEEKLVLSILLGDSGTYVGDIEAEDISDLPMTVSRDRETRRRGVRFAALSEEQRAQLEELVERFIAASKQE